MKKSLSTIILITTFLFSPIQNIFANLDNDSQDFITILQTTQQSDTTLATADYDALGTDEAIDPTERKDITDISTTSYLTFNLNVDGKNFINIKNKVKPCPKNLVQKGCATA